MGRSTMERIQRTIVLGLTLVWLLAPSALGFCESCKEAVSSGQSAFAEGLNTSILFMLGMVFTIPLAFGGLVWHSYRSAARRAARGEVIVPPGAERWDARRVV